MKCFVLLALALGIASCAAYSSAIARQMSVYSDVSYCEEAQIRSWNCGQTTAGAQALNPTPFENPERKNAGFIAYNPTVNAIVITFRGSENIQNWITNLDFIRTNYDGCSGCSVHKGFLKAYTDISIDVQKMFWNLKSLYPSAKLVITGHSLGGALAILCAIRFQEAFSNVDLVYTFGQPRIGNDDFAAYYNARLPNTFRLINYADTVCHSPPKAFGFLHHGVEVWYNPRGMQAYKICVSEDKQCANSISTLFFSTSDHSIVNYVSVAVINSESLLQQIIAYFKMLMSSWARQISVWGLSEQQIERLQVQKVQKSLGIKFPYPYPTNINPQKNNIQSQ